MHNAFSYVRSQVLNILTYIEFASSKFHIIGPQTPPRALTTTKDPRFSGLEPPGRAFAAIETRIPVRMDKQRFLTLISGHQGASGRPRHAKRSVVQHLLTGIQFSGKCVLIVYLSSILDVSAFTKTLIKITEVQLTTKLRE